MPNCGSDFTHYKAILSTMSKNSTKGDNHWHNIALHVVDWGHDGPFAVFYNNFNINNNNIKLPPEGEVNSGGYIYRVGRWGNL